MAFKVKNFLGNENVKTLQDEGQFRIVEYQKDMSVFPQSAQTSYFSSKMNIKKRQLICSLFKGNGIILQSGAMQWMAGDIQASTGIKGAGDLFGKVIKSKVTNETAVKPEYSGNGILVTEPTYKNLIIIDMDQWNNSVVLDDGIFLACDAQIKQKINMRSNFSSAVAGGEGLFNLSLQGQGHAVLESECPMSELIELYLENDCLKVDGNFAIAWSSSLDFTVERSTKSLLGSAASCEGLVNVYRGTGKVLMMPAGKDRWFEGNYCGSGGTTTIKTIVK